MKFHTHLALASFLVFTIAPSVLASEEPISLSERCPPGFELVGEQPGRCELRSLYQAYSSLAGEGVGGLKTGLPSLRDGFTPQQIDLGRYLFFDPVLSRDNSVSCATCHQPALGFSDGRGRSIGIDGHQATRSAPSLWNVAFLKRLFWDGRASSLEEQMQGPLFDPTEMGNSPDELLEALNAIPAYRSLFAVAFGHQRTAENSSITLDEIYTAIAAFEGSLISLNSRYDQYAHGHAGALNANEIEGLNVFRSFVARCAECHTPPLFTNQQIAVIGTPEPPGQPRDIGAAGPSGDYSQRGGFKVPGLRNITKTAPYMHSGHFHTLADAVEFYNKGRGHAVPENEELYLHWHIWEPDLPQHQLDRLVDFLGTLTDESFKPKIPVTLPSGLVPVAQ